MEDSKNTTSDSPRTLDNILSLGALRIKLDNRYNKDEEINEMVIIIHNTLSAITALGLDSNKIDKILNVIIYDKRHPIYAIDVEAFSKLANRIIYIGQHISDIDHSEPLF